MCQPGKEVAGWRGSRCSSRALPKEAAAAAAAVRRRMGGKSGGLRLAAAAVAIRLAGTCCDQHAALLFRSMFVSVSRSQIHQDIAAGYTGSASSANQALGPGGSTQLAREGT